MAVCLYREGDSHVIGGIPCEVGLFDIVEVSYQLDRGWHESVDGIAGKPEKSNIESVIVHPIRLKAREAGIEGWDKRRIKKLEAELNGITEG